MELFNIYNSYIMRPLPFVINALFTKKEIRKTELKKLISNVVDTKSEKDVLSVLVDDKYIKTVYLDTDNNCSDNIFNWENNCLIADDIVKSPLPIVFSKQEKEYIRLILQITYILLLQYAKQPALTTGFSLLSRLVHFIISTALLNISNRNQRPQVRILSGAPRRIPIIDIPNKACQKIRSMI